MYDASNGKGPPEWSKSLFTITWKFLLVVACLGLFAGAVVVVWAWSVKLAPFVVVIGGGCLLVYWANKNLPDDTDEGTPSAPKPPSD